MLTRVLPFAFLLVALSWSRATAAELQHGHADSDGVRIHYVTAGKGPLVILLHGFPDYWYSWRHQLPVMARHHQVVAVDLRGFNRSDQPAGVANYDIAKLVGDVRAVIRHFQRNGATLIGHDWGGFIAWNFAMKHPGMTQRLVILNLPHPHGIQRELSRNPQQRKNSQYARNFQLEGAEKFLTPEGLAGWVKEPQARKKYVEAFRRSSLAAMLGYYKANYPRPPYLAPKTDPTPVQCPVLMFHGLKDRALLSGGLDGTWRWVNNELTLITIPGAGHFVHHDAREQVTRRMAAWLTTTGIAPAGDEKKSTGK